MFLTVLNPHGEVISLALTDLAVWSLELRATKYRQVPPPQQEEGGEVMPDKPRTLALGIVFITDAGQVFQPIAAIDLACTTGEVGTIASDGLGKANAAENKASLRDRLGMLHNGGSESATAIDERIAKASGLADVHATIVRALWGTAVSLDASAATVVKGEFEGWRYAITRTRFEPVFIAGAAAVEGMGTPPGLGLGRPPAPVSKGGRRLPPAPVTTLTAGDPAKPDLADTPPAE